MEPLTFVVISCALLGIIAGLLAGMLGIGGGLIIVPTLSFLLVKYLHMAPEVVMPVAIATSLSTIIFTGASSALSHYKLGNVNRPLMIAIGGGITLGAIVGANIAAQIDGNWLRIIFSCLLMLIAVQMVIGPPRDSVAQAKEPVLALIGGVIGSVSAMMGIGGGALLVPALVWFNVNVRVAIGCAALGGMIIAMFGTLSFIVAGWHEGSLTQGRLGYVYWPATVSIVTTSVVAANWGAKLGQKLNTVRLKQILAALLVVVSIRMLMGIE